MNDTIKFLQNLISCKSITPNDDGALPLLKSKLEELGFSCHLLIFEEAGYEPVMNLYARYGTDAPNLCFAGHTDVVPTGDITLWSHNPFSGIIDQEYLYGRGAVDMKGAIAAFLGATKDFIKQQFSGSISFLITGDEEDIAINGTPKLLDWLKQKEESIDYCIVGEPTNPEKLGEMIKIGRRGSITFNLTVNGKQGHVAYPHNAINPITILTNILKELVDLKLDQGNEYFQPSNLEIVNLDVGNTADNVIPEQASAQFNIRFNDLHDSNSLIKKIDHICNQHTESYKLANRVSGESFITKPSAFTEQMKSSVEKIMNITPEYSTTGGTSDARFIKNICPVLEFGLINKTAHKIDEKICINDVANLQQIYYSMLEKFFNR